ncbi:MAG: MerR family transcriptional regulator [Acidobacteria bacterium]|jgi:DNA-binding transcriptional MerR regulator|nr:MerR family transcriptional regulator [Acidobacteriota bacterium]
MCKDFIDMDYRLPDKLTFKRAEVIKITRLDGKVIDFWEKEFGGIAPIPSAAGEKLYSKQDIELIMKIKQLMIVEKIEKSKIKKIIEETLADFNEDLHRKTIKSQNKNAEKIKMIRVGLEEILTILNKNGK